MADLLVKLYALPDSAPAIARCREAGVRIARARSWERAEVLAWIESQFGSKWRSEAAVAFGGHPIGCFIARDETGNLAGFACCSATFLGFFGPIGVDEGARGKGIGSALLLRTLEAMRDAGFAYAVIGAAADPAWFADRAGAIPIPDSDPGPYG